jgi:hypothetical protein
MHVSSGTTVVSLIRANWRDYSWRQLELSPDFQSLLTQNIYIEKPTGRDWKKKELGESSNYSLISKTVVPSPPLIFTRSYHPNNPKYDYLSFSQWQRYYCSIL